MSSVSETTLRQSSHNLLLRRNCYKPSHVRDVFRFGNKVRAATMLKRTASAQEMFHFIGGQREQVPQRTRTLHLNGVSPSPKQKPLHAWVPDVLFTRTCKMEIDIKPVSPVPVTADPQSLSTFGYVV